MATKAKGNPEAETNEPDAQAPPAAPTTAFETLTAPRAALAEEALAALQACETEAQLIGTARTYVDKAKGLR